MALAAPMVLGFLKNHVTQNRLDARRACNLLAGQSDFLKPRLDSRIASALGFGSVGAFLSSLTGAAGVAAGRAADTAGALGRDAVSAAGSAAAATRPVFVRWLPWIVLGALALILLPQLRYCGEAATKKAGDVVGEAAKTGATAVAGAVKTFDLPNGVKIDVSDGGFMATLIAFLNGKDAALGKGYRFDEVYFDTASATLNPESMKQLEQLAVVLKAFPAVAISVEGHTDSTGDAATNKTLSAERAAAVEQALERMGIDDARVTSVGYGPGKPIASNDTEDGRAQNRRVEVVVMKR